MDASTARDLTGRWDSGGGTPARRGQHVGVEQVRQAVAGAIRARVAGPAGQDHARELFDSDGPRWFGPDRPIWRVHADASIFVGALRALLLQSLHPLAMAGVADHSDYRADPWGRLQRTARFLAATTYGTEDQADQACATVRRVHRRVHGIAPDGRPYDANDPHLLTWVHIAEADSFLAAYQRYGAQPMDAAEQDAYIGDLARVAITLGVPDPPRSVAGLRDRLDAYRPELSGTPAAREAARFLLLQPPVPLAARGPYAVLGATAVSLLPWWAKVMLRIPPLPVTETVVIRPAGRVLVNAMRWALSPGSPMRDAPRDVAAALGKRHTDDVSEPQPAEPGSEDPEVALDELEDPQAALDELEQGPPFDDEPAAPAPPPRRRSIASNSVLAAAMLGLRDALEGPKEELIVIQAEVPGEPPDIDRKGLHAELEDGSLAVGPPLDELKDQAAAARRKAKRRRRLGRL